MPNDSLGSHRRISQAIPSAFRERRSGGMRRSDDAESSRAGAGCGTRRRRALFHLCRSFRSKLQLCSLIAGIVAVACLSGGCSKTSTNASVQSSAFDKAPAQTRQTWERAQDSAKNGDFLGAATNLIALERVNGLSAEQKTALMRALDVVGTKAFQAAENGDKRATEAVKVKRGARRAR